MPSWVRRKEQVLKSPVWDPAKGAVLAKKEERSWRYLSGPAWKAQAQRPRSPPLAFKVLSYSLVLCHLTSVSAVRLSPK
jgi:hypothetical protein